MRVVLDVPTNLGLRPPAPGSVPGTDKAPYALREAGLHRRLTASGWHEAGVVLGGRYAPDIAGREIRNQGAILAHADRLSRRVAGLLEEGARPLLLGGDCSVLLGVAMALDARGRYGLVHVDGHTDFRHPGNSTTVSDLAGEDLAAATGHHLPAISPKAYVQPEHVAHLGCRDDDVNLAECERVLGAALPASAWMADVERAHVRAREVVEDAELDGYWIHVDVDVLDPEVMPAVDSPDPGGVTPDHLKSLLGELWPGAVGLDVCILDPDLDPAGHAASVVVDILCTVLLE